MDKAEVLRCALAWHSAGVGVIPLAYRGKMSLVKWKPWATRRPPRALLRQWIERRWPCNIGLLLSTHRGGDGTRLVVADFDVPSAYVVWRHKNPKLAQTYTVKTARGWHVYLYALSAPLRTCAMAGGELKTTGYVVAPPSVHRTGHVYAEVDGALPDRKVVVTVESVRAAGIAYDEHALRVVKYSTESGEDGVVSRIKDAVPILGFLMRHTTVVPRRDGTYMAVCPFHDDHNPSMQVWPQEDRCYCYSPACPAHRRCDVITCVELMMGVDSLEAIRILASEVG